MADDILLTPEEQDERAKQWLKDNGLAIVVGIALGLGGIFGYQEWQAKQVRDAETASALYSQALDAFRRSELADISSMVDNLKAEYPSSPYAVKASLLRARQLSISNMPAAEEELAWSVANAGDDGLKHTALIRQAKILFGLGKFTEAKIIAQQNIESAFASNYHELLGDIAVQDKDFGAARTQYNAAIDSLLQENFEYSAILNLKINRLPAAVPDQAGE